jgi:hypothetical protein
VGEVPEARRDSFDLLDQRVEAFDGAVGVAAGVPGQDRVSPLGEGAGHASDFGGGGVSAAFDDAVEPACSAGLVTPHRVEVANHLFGTPGFVHLAVRVTGGEQLSEAGAVVGVEAFCSDGQQLAAAI